MYRKVLIPLDHSKEAEGVFLSVKDQLSPDAEVILLRVIPPSRTRVIGGQTLVGSQMEESERSKAEAYLRSALRKLDGDPDRWSCEVIIFDSVAEGIVGTARRSEVDLIAMYTHDRKGLAALIKKSIAKEVQNRATIEVKVFRPTELAAVA